MKWRITPCDIVTLQYGSNQYEALLIYLLTVRLCERLIIWIKIMEEPVIIDCSLQTEVTYSLSFTYQIACKIYVPWNITIISVLNLIYTNHHKLITSFNLCRRTCPHNLRDQGWYNSTIGIMKEGKQNRREEMSSMNEGKEGKSKVGLIKLKVKDTDNQIVFLE